MLARIPNYEKRFEKLESQNKAFVITSDDAIDRKLRIIDGGIYDKKLGEVYMTDQDLREYSCECGNMRGRFYANSICPDCETPIRAAYGQDIKRFGWLDIAPYKVMNPKIFYMVNSILGVRTRVLSNIINTEIVIKTPTYNPGTTSEYDGIGLVEFEKRFFEIVTPIAMKKGKMDLIKYFEEHKDCLFTSKIPVMNIYMRPVYISEERNIFSFDKINKWYMKMMRAAVMIKRAKSLNRHVLRSLSTIQHSWAQLFDYVIDAKVNGKYRIIRSNIIASRLSFSARMVIVSKTNQTATFDTIDMSYKGFLELYSLEILNCMMNGIGSQAFMQNTAFQNVQYLNKTKYSETFDPEIYAIMDKLVKDHKDGLWILINRNPTLELGSIQCLRIERVIPNPKVLVMAVPLNILVLMNGDFDGDVLNIYSLKEKQVMEAFRKGFNTRLLTIDCTGSGSWYNNGVGLIKDEFTNIHALLSESYWDHLGM